MNRREVLSGMFAVAAVTVTPAALDAAIASSMKMSEQELLDFINSELKEIYTKLWQDFCIYGNCFAEQLDEFPWVRRIPPEEWLKNYERLTG